MTTSMTPAEAPVIVLVERECTGHHDPTVHEIARAADGRHIHLVAPAGAIARERWLIDVEARERVARDRLHGWTTALAPLALAVDGEVGDESPRLALADAQRELGRDAVLLSVGDSKGSPRRPNAARAPRAWLRDPATAAGPAA
jgi:hypothetical protein